MSNNQFAQTAGEVLMIRPCGFCFNTQTAANNAFQVEGFSQQAQDHALQEFDAYVELLQSAGVKVNVVEDTPRPHTPDSIFPNNWFSTHSDGTLVLYPMFAQNRREERKQTVIDFLIEKYDITSICDLTPYEKKNLFLEGTGSMVIDREHGVVFACRSPRTNETVLKEFSKYFGWDYILFEANDMQGGAIYHTNVMMSVGSKFAILCTESITDKKERTNVVETLKGFGKDIIEISFDQMNHFAGNMLELHASRPVLVMSDTAKKAMQLNQMDILQSYYGVVAPKLDYIEKNGGGSARCMMAEIFF